MMNQYLSRKALILTLALFLTISSFSLAATNSPQSGHFDHHHTLAQNLDGIINQFIHPNTPGMAIMIIDDGRPALEKCYGMADLGQQTPIKPETAFYLASVTKQFTAMACMILAERKQLSTDALLRSYLPNIPKNWDSITIHQLLTHQSGIPDYINDLHLSKPGLTNQQAFAAITKENRLLFQPGSRFRYSNSNYLILSLIIEKLTGRSYREFVTENIFQPLGMKHAVIADDSKPIIANRAIGYSRKWLPYDYQLATTGDGGIYATMEDLYHWDQGLYSEKLIKKETLAKIYTPYVMDPMFGYPYGYGWWIGDYEGHQFHTHSGAMSGFRNAIIRFPNDRFSIILLSNGSYENEIAAIMNEIVIYHFGEKTTNAP